MAGASAQVGSPKSCLVLKWSQGDFWERLGLMFISNRTIEDLTATRLLEVVERYDAGDTSITVDEYDDAIETLDEMGCA
jgi:hypothetical protein